MKSIYLLIIITAIVLSSCESLDLDLNPAMSARNVETNFARTKSHCLAVYSIMEQEYSNIGNGMMASATDEAEHTLETSNIQKFNTGAWNPYDNPDNKWDLYFRGVRIANNFLMMSDSVNLEVLRLDPAQQIPYQARIAEIKNWKYEVRFLRAFFYFELIKRYGGVPILTEALSYKEDFSGVQRQNLDSCINFIQIECDTAAKYLPLKYSVTSDVGRVTKGAALALKSRVLLYAASDLFNTPPGGYSNPELVSLPTDVTRAVRWQDAANAAMDVINLAATAPYSITNNYRAIFQAYINNEIIFGCGAGTSNNLEMADYPIGFDKTTGNSTTPSQNLVDAYEVKVNATTCVPFDWKNPDHAANPFTPAGTLGRDPRLGLSIILNNTLYKGRVVECWTGGKDGQGVPLATKTGYYLKKHLDENINLLTNTKSTHFWIYMRYAEILLNYAEALNEAQGPIAAVYNQVNAIRTRAGVAMPALPVGLTQSQMREAIRHERQVELAFENHRAWDVRRWMLGEKYFNVPIRGVEITQTAPDTFIYVPKDVETRVFEPKMYFYPIPQSELNIMTTWVQNPGW